MFRTSALKLFTMANYIINSVDKTKFSWCTDNDWPMEPSFQSKADFNPLTPISDQDRISPYSINTISSKQVMWIKKKIS